MSFKKAAPEQARLKVSEYGPPGSGKTFTTLLMAEGLAKVRGKRIAYVDTERGTDFYAQAVKARQVHPDAFDFDALYTRSISDVIDAVKSLNPATHGVLVLDSISHLWDAAMEGYQGRKTKIDSIPMQAWGKIKKPYKDLVRFCMESPFDVFILGRQKNIFETSADTEEMTKTGVGMRAEGETQYEPHICLRFEAKQNPANTTQSIYCMHVEKDRTGVLAGKTIRDPSFATIEPILPLLGEVQAKLDDEDDRLGKDGELMDQQETKQKEKADKSAGLFAELRAKISSTKTLEEIGAFANEMKKAKRYLTDIHTDALREVYKSHRDSVVNQQAADI